MSRTRVRSGRPAAVVAAGVIAAAALSVGGAAKADAPAAAGAVPAAPATTTPGEFSAPGTMTTMRLGPFSLPPTPLGTLPHQNKIIPQIAQPCADCYITGIRPRLVYADGSNADMTTGVMLHHLVIFDTAKPDLTCAREDGIGAAGRRLFASGDERTPFALPEGYGFKVTPGRWLGVVELMNHTPLPKDVFFEADVWTVPASTPHMKPVTPVWLDIANCLDSEYSVPAGRSSTDWSWVSSITGKIVTAAGHVHAGGVGTVLTNGTTGKRICASEAGYGSPAMKEHDMAGTDHSAMDRSGMDHSGMDHASMEADPLANMVTSMSACSWDKLGTVKKGEKLTLTSIYDTPAKMDGVMGIMLLAVHETSDLKSGSTAPRSMRATPDTKVPAGVAADHSLLPMDGGGHQH